MADPSVVVFAGILARCLVGFESSADRLVQDAQDAH